jgi:RNA polymerase sigma factor (sigma-70 family)
MPDQPTGPVLRLIRDLAGVPAEGATDAQLVERFSRERSEVAFETLLRRHGPMVLRLCRRLLGHEQDAEDVFQATFLILAKKPGALRKSSAVGPFLFGTASRLARKYRARAGQRRAREQHVPNRPSPDEPLAHLSVLEAERILHEELARLPERYRAPLVLCYLEGKTRDEAARELGYRLGTFKDRLERARHLLEVRLTRRGVGLSSALIAGLVADAHASAAVSSVLVHSTARAAVGGKSVATSASVRALVKQGLRSLLVIRARNTAGLIVAAALVGSAVGVHLFGPAAADPPATQAEKETRVSDAGPPPAVAAKPAVDALGDPLPPGALKRLGTRRHRVHAWHGLPDGRSYLVYHGGIRRIDADSGRVLETWPVPPRHHAAGFSPDGRYVLWSTSFVFYTGIRLPGQKDEQKWALTLYDLVRRKAVWEQSALLEQKDWKQVDSACFSADGKWIATTGRLGGALRLWDGSTGKELWQHPQGATFLDPLGFADGGDTVVCRGNSDGAIYRFDRVSGKERRAFPTLATSESRQCVLAPDGTCVLVGTSGPTVRIWDLATGQERAPLEGHKRWAERIAFSRDGRMLVTGGGDTSALVREWPSGTVIRRLDTQSRYIERMEVSGDGRRLQMLFWGEQALHFFDLATGKELPVPLECHEAGVYGVATASDGKLLSFGKDATVRTWDPATGKAIGRLSVEKDLNAGGFAVSADGRLLAVPTSNIDAVCLSERATGKLLRKLPASHGVMRRLVFSPDGRWLAASEGTSGAVQAWDVHAGRTVFQAKYPVSYGSIACTFSPDSRRFAVSDLTQVRFFETGTWKEQPGLQAFGNMGLAFSPDGRTLATASVEGVRLYELASRRQRAHIRPPDYPSGVLRFSGNGRWLAWTASRTTIHVWDVNRGALLAPFTGHDDDVTGLAFVCDDRVLASSSEDSTLLLWDVAGAAARNPLPKAPDVEQAWQALASDDAAVAYVAIRALAASPDAAVPLFARHLKPAASADAKRVAACLRDLDSAEFSVRDRATEELEQMGDAAAPALERFLAGKPALEAKRRAERLLAKARWQVMDPERLRQIRALEALERIDNDATRRLFETLAGGDPDARLTREAKAALARLRR